MSSLTDEAAIQFLLLLNLFIFQWVPNYDQPSEETNKPGEEIHEKLEEVSSQIEQHGK